MEQVTAEPDRDATFAIIDLLLTVGYIDGLLHADEETFIRMYMGRLAERMSQKSGTVEEWRARLESVYSHLAQEMAHISAEVVAAGDDQYKRTRLKVRAVALFRTFSPSDQAVALDLLTAMTRVDGTIDPAEAAILEELVAYFRAAPVLPVAPTRPPLELLQIDPSQALPLQTHTHPWLDPLEQRYSKDPLVLQQQLAADYNLIFQAISVWERQRARGTGRLLGISDIGQLPVGTRMLDGHVHVMRPDRPTELVVLGDLHGCYSTFKAALLQSNFIERALAHQADPLNQTDIKLVLLGDYIDRGFYSFDGVVRIALQLLVSLPDYVVMLRGNHEFLMRHHDNRITSAVNPAEALPSIIERGAPLEIQEAFRYLFEHMPTSLVVDRTLFVHAGIPRDDTMTERYRDLSSLEDAVVRFEMMWSDPVETDRVPATLQRESPRFNFGSEQFVAFMERIGCHALVRGHEQVDAGFETVFDVGHKRLHTLFSAGGRDNNDLPTESRYRNVTPMAMTIFADRGTQRAVPWPIQYQPFTSAANNGFYR